MVNGYKWYTAMALKFKDLEALAAAKTDAWTPEGAPNLYAFSRRSGRVSWVCRVVIGGKRNSITIGPWPEVKADVARQVSAAIKALVNAGHGAQAIKNAVALSLDPLEISRLVTGERTSNEAKTPTFEAVATEWYEKHLKDGLSDGPYKRQVFQQLRDHAFPALGGRPVNELKRREIVNAIRDLWMTAPPTGKKVRGNIERVLDYAVDLEFCEFNACPPVRSMPKSQHVEEHFGALEPERAPEFWAWLNQRPRMGPQTKLGLSLALLLAKRTGEIRRMEWAHIDLERGIWTTPASGMKMRKAHRQPLSELALALIRGIQPLTGDQRYVLGWKGDKPLSENAMLYALKRFDPNITVHGFRACLGSWMAENGVRKVVADYIKAHQPKSLDAAYQRSDLLEERREVLERWASYVTQC
jgi:integrase